MATVALWKTDGWTRRTQQQPRPRRLLRPKTSGVVAAGVAGDGYGAVVAVVGAAVAAGGYGALRQRPRRKCPPDCAAVDGAAAVDGDAAAAGVAAVGADGAATTIRPTWTMTSRHRRRHAAANDGACGAHDRGRCRGDYRCYGCSGGRECGDGATANGVCCAAAVVGAVGADGACCHQIPSQPPRTTT